MKRRFIIAFLIALFIIGGSPVTPAYATIDQPDSFSIVGTTVYRGVIEPLDQLWLIEWVIDYTDIPDTGADETFIIRIMEGAVEHDGVVPYDFYNDGYASGVSSFYFAPADVLTWGAAPGTYGINFCGNPLQNWEGGAPPSTTNTAISWETDSTQVTPQIVALAVKFESDWGWDLIEPIVGVMKLTTTYGEPYFATVIANLSTIAPLLFTGALTTPVFEERDHTQAGATAVEEKWIGVAPVDLTALAAVLGISRMWLTSMFWILASFVITILVSRISESREPAAFMFGACLLFGSIMGFCSYVIGVLGAALAGFIIVHTFFWSKTT